MLAEGMMLSSRIGRESVRWKAGPSVGWTVAVIGVNNTDPRGKSGLHRARWWVTPTRGNGSRFGAGRHRAGQCNRKIPPLSYSVSASVRELLRTHTRTHT